MIFQIPPFFGIFNQTQMALLVCLGRVRFINLYYSVYKNAVIYHTTRVQNIELLYENER